MKLVRFTDKEGHDVWINPSHVISVHRSDVKSKHTDICTITWIHVVKESVDEIVNKLDIWLN